MRILIGNPYQEMTALIISSVTEYSFLEEDIFDTKVWNENEWIERLWLASERRWIDV